METEYLTILFYNFSKLQLCFPKKARKHWRNLLVNLTSILAKSTGRFIQIVVVFLEKLNFKIGPDTHKDLQARYAVN